MRSLSPGMRRSSPASPRRAGIRLSRMRQRRPARDASSRRTRSGRRPASLPRGWRRRRESRAPAGRRPAMIPRRRLLATSALAERTARRNGEAMVRSHLAQLRRPADGPVAPRRTGAGGDACAHSRDAGEAPARAPPQGWTGGARSAGELRTAWWRPVPAPITAGPRFSIRFHPCGPPVGRVGVLGRMADHCHGMNDRPAAAAGLMFHMPRRERLIAETVLERHPGARACPSPSGCCRYSRSSSPRSWASPAAAPALDVTAEEERRILRHGPGPPAGALMPFSFQGLPRGAAHRAEPAAIGTAGSRSKARLAVVRNAG